jgi:hypothetical protein
MNAPDGTWGFTVLVTYRTTGFGLRTTIFVFVFAFGAGDPGVVTVFTTVLTTVLTRVTGTTDVTVSGCETTGALWGAAFFGGLAGVGSRADPGPGSELAVTNAAADADDDFASWLANCVLKVVCVGALTAGFAVASTAAAVVAGAVPPEEPQPAISSATPTATNARDVRAHRNG